MPTDPPTQSPKLPKADARKKRPPPIVLRADTNQTCLTEN